VLFLVSTSNFVDRNVVSVLLEPIKREFHISDTSLGLLSGFCFALFYALAGLPVARWADRGNRRTILTVAISVWSVMTMLCGFAHTFWQLALARVGVGAGESGVLPASQSLIVDYFPRERRATALAIFNASGISGYLLGITAGGYIAAMYGWRAVFLFAGAPGIALALVARCALAEPRLLHQTSKTAGPSEKTMDALHALWQKRSFICGLAGCLCYWFFSYGGLVFLPSLLVRTHHVSLAEVSVVYGTVAAFGSILGAVGGGWLADSLAARDIRWAAWLPTVSFTLAGPVYMMTFLTNDFRTCMVFAFVGLALITGGLSPGLLAIHSVCGDARRATAVALVYFSATLIGGGFGPLATGALSDILTASYGDQALRYALTATTSLLVVSGMCFYSVGRVMSRDLEG